MTKHGIRAISDKNTKIDYQYQDLSDMHGDSKSRINQPSCVHDVRLCLLNIEYLTFNKEARKSS